MRQLGILHLDAACCFARVFFFAVALVEGVFAGGFEDVAGPFAFVLDATCALVFACDVFARTCVTGAKWTG
jgi:hypothetical protein